MSRRVSRHPAPSFSSTLLDKIYLSIDGDQQNELVEPDICNHRQSRCGSRSSDRISPTMEGILRPSLAERKALARGKGRHVPADFDRKLMALAGDDSSNSSSSDSSYGGFSSSDTDSMYSIGRKQKLGCLLTPALSSKPVRTASVPLARPDKSGKREGRQMRMVDDRCRYPLMEENELHHDESIIKSKSRALKIYANLKKVKQPISPGGRLSSFINSLFASGSMKKPKNFDDSNVEGLPKSMTCSSARSFTRSCLSGNSPGTRERLRDGAKRTVRFCPVTMIVDEDLKPSGDKSLYVQDQPISTSVQVPSIRKAGRYPGRKTDNDNNIRHNAAMEKSLSVKATARDFLKDYHQSQKRNRSSPRYNYRANERLDAYDEEDDDDATSCSSSDLFELDHLMVVASDSRYCEELPVYETTLVRPNLAIANGVVV